MVRERATGSWWPGPVIFVRSQVVFGGEDGCSRVWAEGVWRRPGASVLWVDIG